MKKNTELFSKLTRSFWIRNIYFMMLWTYKYPSFIRDYIGFRRSLKTNSDNRFSLTLKGLYPSLFDKTTHTNFDPHYTYHPAWAARIISKNNPSKHIDVSSILHFSTIVSAFVPVEFYDYRPADVKLSNLACKNGDLLNLPFKDNSVESLSCMHTIEHIGLGRYGDPIDARGDIKAAKELSRVLQPKGTFIFVAPIGRSRIEYNSHRIYSYEQVMDLFKDLKLVEFSMVPDDYHKTGLIVNADKDIVKEQVWACGCFLFTK